MQPRISCDPPHIAPQAHAVELINSAVVHKGDDGGAAEKPTMVAVPTAPRYTSQALFATQSCKYCLGHV